MNDEVNLHDEKSVERAIFARLARFILAPHFDNGAKMTSTQVAAVCAYYERLAVMAHIAETTFPGEEKVDGEQS